MGGATPACRPALFDTVALPLSSTVPASSLHDRHRRPDGGAAGGRRRTASAAPPDTHRLATWNMQVGSDRWSGALTLSRSFDVVALREVPAAAPAGAFPLGQQGNIRSYL